MKLIKQCRMNNDKTGLFAQWKQVTLTPHSSRIPSFRFIVICIQSPWFRWLETLMILYAFLTHLLANMSWREGSSYASPPPFQYAGVYTKHLRKKRLLVGFFTSASVCVKLFNDVLSDVKQRNLKLSTQTQITNYV